MKISFFAKLIAVLFLGWLVVFIIDPLDPSTLSTPFCLGLILMGLSLRQSAPLVVSACAIYSIFTAYALISFNRVYSATVHVNPHPYFWLFQREGLFLVLCAMAIYLAYYRTAAERTRSHLQDILSNLPAPVVISDATGFIIYANETLRKVFKPTSKIVGKRYVEAFMGDIQEGKAMRYYIEVFSGHDKGIHEIGVRPFGGAMPMTARITCLGTGPSRVMITVLSKREDSAYDVSLTGHLTA